MFTMIQTTLTKEGSDLTGEAENTIVTRLDPKLMDALNFKIVSDGFAHSFQDVAKRFCEANEEIYLVGLPYQLRTTYILLNDLVFLRREHVKFRTGLAVAKIKIETPYASLITDAGWTNRYEVDILIPEDGSIHDGQAAIKRVLDRIEFAPRFNTGGWEDLAHLVTETFGRMKNNFHMYNHRRLWDEHFHIQNRSKYVTASISLAPGDRSDLDVLSGIWAPTAEEKDKLIAGELSFWKHK